MAIQRGNKLIYSFGQLLDILLTKYNTVRLDKYILGSREPGLLISIYSYNRVEESYNRFASRDEGNGDI